MRSKLKGLLIGIVIGAIISASTTFALNGTLNKLLEYRDIKIVVDGNRINPTDADGNYVEPFIIDGTTYLPVRAIGSAFGKEVSWDGNTFTVYIGEKPALDYTSAFAENIKDVIDNYGRYVDADYMGVKGLKYGTLIDFENDSVPELVLCHDMKVKVYRFDGEKSTLIYSKELGSRYMQTDVSPRFTIKTTGEQPVLMTYHSTKEWCEEVIDIFSVENGQPKEMQISARNTDDNGDADFNEFIVYGTTVSKTAYDEIRKSLFNGAKHVDALWTLQFESENMINATEDELNVFLAQFGL